MKVFKIWCEWDIGINDDIFISYEIAARNINIAIEECGVAEDDPDGDYSIEALMDEGLLDIEEVEVVEE